MSKEEQKQELLEAFINHMDEHGFRADTAGSRVAVRFWFDKLDRIEAETRKQVVEEILRAIPIKFIDWRRETNKRYGEGRKTHKTQVLLDFPTWLQENIASVYGIQETEKPKLYKPTCTEESPCSCHFGEAFHADGKCSCVQETEKGK